MNILLKLLNAVGTLLNPATEEAQRDNQGAYRNIILNPSIELATDVNSTNWYPSYTGGQNPSLTVTKVQDATALLGSYIGRLSQAVATSDGGTVSMGWGHRDTNYYAVMPGRRYCFEVGFRARRSLTGLLLRVQAFSDVGASAASEFIDSTIVDDVGTDVGWVRLRHEFVVPLGRYHAAFSVMANKVNGITGDYFDIDDVRVYEMPQASSKQADELRGNVDETSAIGRIVNVDPFFQQDFAGRYGVGYYGSGVNPMLTLTRMYDNTLRRHFGRVANTVTPTGLITPSFQSRKFTLPVGSHVTAIIRVRSLYAPTKFYATLMGWASQANGGGLVQTFSGVDHAGEHGYSGEILLRVSGRFTGSTVNNLTVEARAEYGDNPTPRALFDVLSMHVWVNGVEQNLAEINAKLDLSTTGLRDALRGASNRTLTDLYTLLSTQRGLATTLWTDNSGANYVRRDTIDQNTGTVTVTFTDANGNAATPGAGLRPLVDEGETVESLFTATAGGTGYSANDILARVLVIDTSVSPPGLAATWMNVTQGTIISAPTGGTYDAFVGLTDDEFRTSTGKLGRYKAQDIDDAATPAYYGFIAGNGDWYIMREALNGLVTEYRYANLSNNSGITGGYSGAGADKAWVNRATLTYGYLNTLTGL